MTPKQSNTPPQKKHTPTRPPKTTIPQNPEMSEKFCFSMFCSRSRGSNQPRGP